MKRDMELIWRILEHIEDEQGKEWESFYGPSFNLPDLDNEQARYHLGLCIDVGYINMDSKRYVYGLTWAGHDALEEYKKKRDYNPVI